MNRLLSPPVGAAALVLILAGAGTLAGQRPLPPIWRMC